MSTDDQLGLFPVDRLIRRSPEGPDLASYDRIVVSSSAGKDSQAMLDYLVQLADAAGVRDRIVVVHADLGRVEWEGTRALAEEQASAYRVRFEAVSRIGGISPGGRSADAPYRKGERFGDLLDHVERRRKWPGPGNARYCTSDHKRGPIRKLITALHREHGVRRPFRVLNCMGMRAEESPHRAAMAPFVRGAAPGTDSREGCTAKRHVDTWLPIHHWTEREVWERIRSSGVRYHHAYDLGMPRLSCVFCIFAPKAALLIAAKHNPALLDEYVRIEDAIGHTFKHGLSLRQVRDELRAGAEPDTSALDGAWGM